MTVSSAVPVAVTVSLGALATMVAVGLAWKGARHMKTPLVMLLVAESANFLLLGALNSVVASFGYRPVFAMTSFLAVLYLQEVVTPVISLGMTLIIFEKSKTAGLLPEYVFRWRNSGYHRLFSIPFYLLIGGLFLSFFPPHPYTQIVWLLGMLWLAAVISFLAKVWPEERVLKRMTIFWMLRIVLALSLYFVVIPLVARTLGIIEMEDRRDNEDPVEYQAKREQFLRETLPKIDAFLTSHEGIAVTLLVLVYKIAVMGTVGGAGRVPWNLPENELNEHNWPNPPAEAPAEEQGVENGGSALESEPLVPEVQAPRAQAAAAPSALQRYPFYL